MEETIRTDRQYVAFLVQPSGTFMTPKGIKYPNETAAVWFAQRLVSEGSAAHAILYGIEASGEQYPIGAYRREEGKLIWTPYEPLGETVEVWAGRQEVA